MTTKCQCGRTEGQCVRGDAVHCPALDDLEGDDDTMDCPGCGGDGMLDEVTECDECWGTGKVTL